MSDNIYQPDLMEVVQVRRQTADVKSVRIRFRDESRTSDFAFRVGQFGIFSAFGAGESTFNICSSSNWNDFLDALDSVQAGAILLNPAGSIRFINARFSQYFAMDHRQVRSLEVVEDLHALIAPRFRTPETFAAPWRAFAAGSAEPGHDELEMTRPTRRVLERFARPVQDNEGRTVGWLELYTDVTGERQIQSKLLQTGKNGGGGPAGVRNRARIE